MRRLARAALLIAAVTAAARVMGFLRIAVFARTVGTTPLGDTYQTANTLPNILFEVVAGGALAAAVVPVVAASAEDRERTRAVVSGLLTWTVLLLAPVALTGMLLARPLTALLVGGTADPALRAAKVDVGARMLVVFLPQVVLYGAGVVLSGALQAHRRFVGPALAPLLSSVVVIAVYVTYRLVAAAPGSLDGLTRGEELLLAAGTTAGVAVLSLSLLVPWRRLGLPLAPTLALPDGVAARVRRLALAAVVGVVAQQLALAVVLRLCNVVPGAVVVHQIAFTVYLLPWAVLAVPVATAAFPALSAASPARYADVAAGALRTVLLAMAWAAAVLAATAWPVASLVAGASPGARTAPGEALPHAIVAFAPGLVGYGAVALLTRALYARDRARAVAVATVAGFAVAALLAVLLAARADAGDRVAAVGAANSAGMTVAGLLLAFALARSAPGALRGAASTLALAVPVAGLAAACGAYAARVGPPVAGAALGAVVATGVYALGTARLPAARSAVGEVRGLLARRGAP
ncbi:MAG TPA: lipid II flippase MurJ [Mycobacteriales bacterium]